MLGSLTGIVHGGIADGGIVGEDGRDQIIHH